MYCICGGTLAHLIDQDMNKETSRNKQFKNVEGNYYDNELNYFEF